MGQCQLAWIVKGLRSPYSDSLSFWPLQYTAAPESLTVAAIDAKGLRIAPVNKGSAYEIMHPPMTMQSTAGNFLSRGRCWPIEIVRHVLISILLRASAFFFRHVCKNFRPFVLFRLSRIPIHAAIRSHFADLGLNHNLSPCSIGTSSRHFRLTWSWNPQKTSFSMTAST